MMASQAVLVVSCAILPLVTSQFVPPDAILEAGYPAGFRAFIPDFPGCEMFAFHGRINTPFIDDNDLGMFYNEILRPQDGFWTFQDLDLVLTPGDILHYWTLIMKDNVPYPKKNLTWTVPDADESVDLLKPITLRPPKKSKPLKPEKMKEAEPTTPDEDDAPTPATETPSTPSTEETSPTSPEPAETSSPPSTTLSTTTPLTTTTKRPTTTSSPKSKLKKSTPATPENQEEEEVEEESKPAPPLEKPITSEFPDEPPLFPFPSIPSLFPRPFKPMMPPSGPGFEICSNPWNFEEQFGDSRTQRLERQVAKLQCELALFQRREQQLASTVENELSDLKKLIYGMVGRMQRLESVIRSAAFG